MAMLAVVLGHVDATTISIDCRPDLVSGSVDAGRCHCVVADADNAVLVALLLKGKREMGDGIINLFYLYKSRRLQLMQP